MKAKDNLEKEINSIKLKIENKRKSGIIPFTKEIENLEKLQELLREVS